MMLININLLNMELYDHKKYVKETPMNNNIMIK